MTRNQYEANLRKLRKEELIQLLLEIWKNLEGLLMGLKKVAYGNYCKHNLHCQESIQAEAKKLYEKFEERIG